MPKLSAFSRSLLPVRMGVSIIILSLAFIGLAFTYLQPLSSRSVWHYWTAVTPIFALLSLLFSWYLRRKEIAFITSIWQDALIWIGMLLAFFVLHEAVLAGFIGRIESGVILLDLLALTIFATGVILDPCFLIIGIILFAFALALVAVERYLSIILLALSIAAVVTLYLLAKTSKKNLPPPA